MATVIKYWPAVVAGLYLAYLVAAGDASQVPAALSAFLVAVGLNQSTASCHAKIDRI